MYLFADSGSTKARWCLVNGEERVDSCVTGGMNPFFLCLDEMICLLEAEFTLPRTGIAGICFYGAGCASPDKSMTVMEALFRFFGTSNIQVDSDMLLAARSLCGNKPGIACILGTGSNSCYYDGKNIVENVSPLGYVLGDEGSGNALGRKLLSDVLKNQLPQDICAHFFDTYRITASEILDNVYNKPFPNRYIAQYAKFVSTNIAYPEMYKLSCDCFRDFFRRNVMQYKHAKLLPVHFTGSVAFHFSEIITKIAGEEGLKMGKILREPEFEIRMKNEE